MANKMDKDEILFVTYHDVIKSYKPFLLEKLRSKEFYFKYFEKIDMEQIEDLTENQLYGFCIRDVFNDPIKSILIDDTLDTESVMMDILDRYPNLYADSKPMAFADSINILLNQSFTKKIYVYTPIYDARIDSDLQEMYYDLDRIKYVTGDFNEVIKSIPEKITTYVINSIHFLELLIDMKKVYLSNVLIADYGYNYCLNEKDDVVLKIIDIDEVSKKEVFKARVFNPYPSYEIV